MLENKGRHEEINLSAYLRWCDAGSPICDGKRFWIEAEKDWEKKRKIHEIRLKVMAENSCGLLLKSSVDKSDLQKCKKVVG